MIGTLTTLLVGVTPGMAADSGTVDAQVTVSSSAACLELSVNAISFGTLALGAEDAPGTPSISVTNCADADGTLLASATDATGTGAAWTLVDSAATCADTLGTDNYHLSLVSPGATTPLRLAATNKEVGTLIAGGSTTHTAEISTACPGSTGAGTTMSMHINYLATNVVAPPPIVLEELPMTQETAQAVADYLFLGTRDFDVAATCSGDVTFACPGGVPSNPLPQIRMTGTNVVATEVVGAARWDTSATLSIQSLQTIPVSSFGLDCQVGIDTAAGSNPNIQVFVPLNFTSYPDPAGPTNRIVLGDITINGLETADFQISGGFLCDAVSWGLSFFLDTLKDSLASYWTGSLCGAPDPDVFMPCPPLP